MQKPAEVCKSLKFAKVYIENFCKLLALAYYGEIHGITYS